MMHYLARTFTESENVQTSANEKLCPTFALFGHSLCLFAPWFNLTRNEMLFATLLQQVVSSISVYLTNKNTF